MMSQAAQQAGLAEDNAANNSDFMAGINAMAGVASLFTGGGSNLLTGLFGDSGGFSPTPPANPNNPPCDQSIRAFHHREPLMDCTDAPPHRGKRGNWRARTIRRDKGGMPQQRR
jgi:hypothetical protein